MDRTFEPAKYIVFSKAGAKVLLFFDMTKFFCKKMHFYGHFVKYTAQIAAI